MQAAIWIKIDYFSQRFVIVDHKLVEKVEQLVVHADAQVNKSAGIRYS